MSPNNTYLAIFLGSTPGPRRDAWSAMSEDERQAKEQEGMKAWGAWMQKHEASIIDPGGPLGRTKRVSREGVEDVSNELAVYIIVRASSHEEAAKMFEDHPHFTIFPCESIDVMPLIPIPGM